MNESRKLLDDYAKSGSEAAFRELVARYVNMVHSIARRLVNGDDHLAEDVTQTVFLNLARKAGTMSSEVMIGGWLHRHTCFVASTVMRGNRRRQIRERQAVEMNETEDHSAANLSKVAPILDEVINELGPEDRAAILLRFFEMACASVIAFAVLAAPMMIQHQFVAKLREENQALQQQAAQLAPLQTENQRLSNMVVQAATGSPAAEKQVRDLARLRAEVASLRQQTNDLAKAITGLRKASRRQTGFVNGKRVLRNMTMAELAKFIGGVLQAPVANQTGLPGTYDIELTPPRVGGEDEKIERVTGILLNELGLRLIPYSGPFTDAEEQFDRDTQTILLPDGTMTNDTSIPKGGSKGFAIELDHYNSPGLKPATGEPELAAQDIVDRTYVDSDTPGLPRAIANTLRSIDSSKQQWALEKRKQNADAPTWEDLRPYLNSRTNGGRPDFIEALGEGSFILGSVGENARLRYAPGGKAVIGGGNAASDDPATAKQYQCINILRVIDSAKQQWALEFGKQRKDTPTMEDLRQYLGRGENRELPAFPDGGVYTLGAVGEKPTCTISGHVLP